ncbi:hypothetical protein QOT17_018989 [Balamuthia mandrillaris]
MHRRPLSVVLLTILCATSLVTVRGEQSDDDSLAEVMVASLTDATCVPKEEYEGILELCLPFLTYDLIYVDSYQPIREGYAETILFSITGDCLLQRARFLCPTFYRECLQVEAPEDESLADSSESNVVTAGAFACDDLCWNIDEACGVNEVEAEAGHNFDCNRVYPAVVAQKRDGTLVYNVTAPNGVNFEFTSECYDESRDIQIDPNTCVARMVECSAEEEECSKAAEETDNYCLCQSQWIACLGECASDSDLDVCERVCHEDMVAACENGSVSESSGGASSRGDHLFL